MLGCAPPGRAGPHDMSTGPQPRRFPLRLVALAAIAVAAIVVLIVVLTGDDDG